MTPFELDAYAEAFNTKQDELREQIITQAYLTAALWRMDKMPTLQSLLKKKDPEKQAMSENDLLQFMRNLNAEAGGVENRTN